VIVAYIDGGARGNPGPAGFGVRIEQDGKPVAEFSEPIGIATNNVAEYRALLAALEWIKRHGHARAHIRSDSQLLVRQMLGQYKVSHAGLQPLHAKARQLAHEIGHVTFEHVERARNAHADRLANAAMDRLERKSRVKDTEIAESTEEGTEKDTEKGRERISHRDTETQSLNRSKTRNETSTLKRERGTFPTETRDLFTPLERAVRLFIYQQFLKTARAPDLIAISRAVGATERDVAAALRRLADMHALVLAPATTNVWMAHPFSAVPTAYPVVARGITYWANCAWDAAGILSLTGGNGETHTRCADCGAEIVISVRNGSIDGDGVVHYAVPPRRFWDNVAYT
jgi:probable phosphoglycerate mutase